ncbi:hypothetical protein [Paraburkholderia sp.]|uniref:hypothetical protein n=1 Tax=Paraburkholderia sp. TaxID=1926495 RepID=UPI00238EE4C6|nr:hypothetical protein [Paraburkholderia sp.]MDE1179451.1 hypothetical protein [Paraburkholderia sp.]
MTDRHTNRGGHNLIDLRGRKFGKLLVLVDTRRRKSRRPIWECHCDCGETVAVLGKYLQNGDTKSCGCFNKGNAHNRDAVAEITLSFWTPITRQAVRRGIPFEVTREFAWQLYLDQGGLCALTGEPIKFSTNIRDQRGTQTASLDRKDSRFGYTENNVQWVHKKVNIMKNVMSNEELFDWCGKVQDWMRSHPDQARPSVGCGKPSKHVPIQVVAA